MTREEEEYYRRTPPVNWRECGPPGLIGYKELKTEEIKQADRRNPFPVLPLDDTPDKVCLVCKKPLNTKHRWATIHNECEMEASRICRAKYRIF